METKQMCFYKGWRLSLLVLGLFLLGCGSESKPTTKVTENNVQAQSSQISTTNDSPNAKENNTIQPNTTSSQEDKEANDRFQFPIVELKTNHGVIKIKLNREAAPETVDNFLHYVEHKHYDGTIFHQAMSDFVILGGSYDTNGIEKPKRYPISNEARNGLKNKRGTIAMSRDQRYVNSAYSQFFINVVDNPKLDHIDMTPKNFGFCVFGEVIEGMKVVDTISKVPVNNTESAKPIKTVLVEKATRL